MAKTTSVIELNGNRYDAVSGHLIGAVKKATTKLQYPSVGKTIDGFMRKPVSPQPLSIKKPESAKTQPAPKKAGLSLPKADAKHDAHTVHRGAQRSETLMRRGVKKPSSLRGLSINKPKLQMAAATPARLWRAKSTAKHNKVKHFNPTIHDSAVRKTTIKATARPVASRAAAAGGSSVTAVQPLPSMITSASHQQLERLLDHALFRADAHKQALKTKRGPLQKVRRMPRWLTVGVSSVVFLAICGAFAWQNVPQLSMKWAAVQAHVTASVPNYTPAGFKLAGPISSDSGKVKMNFQANSDNTRSFSLEQQASQMDSAAVAATKVPANTPVQTSQINGTTVYIYGNSNSATWVNHGVQYTISDNANLNSDQILKIANGL